MQMYFLCYTTACLILVASPAEGPKWSQDYDAAVSAARNAHRPLLLLVENGAEPTSKFELADVESSSEEAELLMRFETCRLDVQTEVGRLIAEGYSVSEYPYLLISDEGCERIVFRGVGRLNASLWRQTLNTYAGRPRQPGHGTIASSSEAEGNLEQGLTEPFRPTSLPAAQRAARRQRRPLIVYVGTQNCPFCDKMRRDTLANVRVRTEVVAGFESVSIEQRDEPTWAEQQGLRIYPTTLVFGSDGELIDRMEGYVKPSDFLQRLKMSREHLLSTMW